MRRARGVEGQEGIRWLRYGTRAIEFGEDDNRARGSKKLLGGNRGLRIRKRLWDHMKW